MLCPHLYAFVILMWLWKAGRLIIEKGTGRKFVRHSHQAFAPFAHMFCVVCPTHMVEGNVLQCLSSFYTPD